jgi:hypothetical protein
LQASGLNPANATITLTACDGTDLSSPSCAEPGEAARVTINYPYTLGLSRLSWVGGRGRHDQHRHDVRDAKRVVGKENQS